MVIRSACPKVYKPGSTYNGATESREPFTTALGLPICAEATPSIEGTGRFFITDPLKPGNVYPVTARHVVFDLDKESNKLYPHRNSSQRRRNVLLFGDTVVEKHIAAIRSEINGKHIISGPGWSMLLLSRRIWRTLRRR